MFNRVTLPTAAELNAYVTARDAIEQPSTEDSIRMHALGVDLDDSWLKFWKAITEPGENSS